VTRSGIAELSSRANGDVILSEAKEPEHCYGSFASLRMTLPAHPATPTCQRCHFPVPTRAMGCKNPCGNCGTVYPLGDCSD